MTTQTSKVTVMGASWADLGTGPMRVENASGNTVLVAVSDSSPSSLDAGHRLGPFQREDFDYATHVWAKARQGSAETTTLVVTIATKKVTTS